MASSLKRLLDDATRTWRAMPRSQALRWYGAVLRHAPTILRERKFYSADREMQGHLNFFLFGGTCPIDVDSINSTDNNGYCFLREFFVRQIYFRAFKHLKFDTCLDLGCNTGIVTSILKQLAGPAGRVVGIDALLYPANAYRAKINATPGITLHHGVICGESVRHDPAALHAMCDKYGFDINLAISVSELMGLYGLHHIDFLKMDIEGAEFAIFRDSAPWLERVDNLAMEVHNKEGDPSAIIDRLRHAGFQVSWLDDAGYPVAPRHAGYIYASRTGSLKG
jgi:FkbM family methyltransferase